MNTAAHDTIAPEVRDFLAAVRSRLADLDPDEQSDITEGLEADLSDLVAERGGEALGDPVAYARELRTAAGLAPEMGRSRRQVDIASSVHSFLDDAHGLFDRSVAAIPGDAAGVLSALQPAWWVLRAWLAVEVAAYFLGSWSLQVIPGANAPGVVALAVAVVLSVQLGRGRLWPGAQWRAAAGLRVLLLGLNAFALLMVPVVQGALGHSHNDVWERGYESGSQQGLRAMRESVARAGLTEKGRPVGNIYPYDAKGRPLVGVQLFDQDGQPLEVRTQSQQVDAPDNGDLARSRVYYPWTNGTTQLLNVFPIPSRVQEQKSPSATAFSESAPPAITPFPMAQVPAVSLPGIRTGRQPVPVAPATPAG
jgi:hypothetical protein